MGPMALPSFSWGFPKIVSRSGITIIKITIKTKLRGMEKNLSIDLLIKMARCPALLRNSGFQCNFARASLEDACGGKSNIIRAALF